MPLTERSLFRRYKEDGGRLKEEAFASRIRLVLNFDINKTIIMSDKVQVILCISFQLRSQGAVSDAVHQLVFS